MSRGFSLVQVSGAVRQGAVVAIRRRQAVVDALDVRAVALRTPRSSCPRQLASRLLLACAIMRFDVLSPTRDADCCPVMTIAVEELAALRTLGACGFCPVRAPVPECWLQSGP